MKTQNAFFWCLLYLTSGTIKSLFYNVVATRLKIDSRSLLLPLLNYLSQYLLTLVLLSGRQEWRLLNWKNFKKIFAPVPLLIQIRHYILLITTFDIVNFFFALQSTSYIGSGLFQLVQASALVFTAILLKMMFKREITRQKWVGIFVITFGLIVIGLSTTSNVEAESTALYVGLFFAFIVAASSSSMLVTREALGLKIEKQDTSISSLEITALIGLYGFCFLSLYAFGLYLYNPEQFSLVPQVKSSIELAETFTVTPSPDTLSSSPPLLDHVVSPIPDAATLDTAAAATLDTTTATTATATATTTAAAAAATAKTLVDAATRTQNPPVASILTPASVPTTTTAAPTTTTTTTTTTTEKVIVNETPATAGVDVFAAPLLATFVVNGFDSVKAEIVILFSIFLLENAIHAVIYWAGVEKAGALNMGITNSLRTVTVVSSSAFFFCSTMATQCITLAKAIGTFVVVSGLLVYTLERSPPRKR